MRRRLLEGLQQRVERMRREHVHFVDQVHLVAPPRRCVLHVVEQLTCVIDLGARGRVHLYQIHEPPFVDFPTSAAFAAGRRRYARFAVQGFGEDARDRRLADPARPGKQKRMVHATRLERVDERPHDVLLSGELTEIARPPFASESEVGHEEGF